MKLSHLSLAIFAAISLAACGGSSSGSGTQVTPDDNKPTEPTKPTKPTEPTKPAEPNPNTPEGDKETVDPTLTEVVTYFDLEKKSSQGSTQYLRNSKSKFDRGNNDKNPASATVILGTDLNKQNPWFTNFVAARTPISKGNKSVTVAQFLGTKNASASGMGDNNSLQTENSKNIKRLGNVTTLSSTQLKDMLKVVDENYKGYFAKLDELKKKATSDDDKKKVDALIAAAKAQHTELRKIYTDRSKAAPYIAIEGNDIWGDGVVAASNNSSDNAASGLVGMNFAAQQQNKQGTVTIDPTNIKTIQGTDDAAVSTTRIFGRYFLEDDSPDSIFAKKNVARGKYNSYRKATSYVKNFDNDQHDFDSAKDIPEDFKFDDTQHSIAVEPMELVNVQYGRVTGKLDPVNLKNIAENMYQVGGNTTEQGEEFRGRNSSDAVSYYFYRGTNATTVDQIAALPSNAVFEYQGHALMYGIDNSYHKDGNNLPNAFGNTSSQGLGNFVVAKYDVGKAKVGGQVYNAWQLDPTSNALDDDALVVFAGDVTGNSVVGSAELAYKAAEKADFRASFFGDKAQELGGSFNSTTWQDKYGPQAGKQIWGGVFGAQRIEEPAPVKPPVKGPTIDNSWLGDIAANVRK